ncbi:MULTISPECIES: hypothetical protein [Planktothrix]|uniref:hypothetical protein n=1 Tax=Planktothrix TaxID=54304 RepID=UPI00040E9BC6|nr:MULTISPECIES: hypothetical protein [Planktothrix]
MKINLNNDQQIIEEVFNILIENLDPSKIGRFWTICNLGSGDYSQLKDKLFARETVDSLYEKIKAQERE